MLTSVPAVASCDALESIKTSALGDKVHPRFAVLLPPKAFLTHRMLCSIAISDNFIFGIGGTDREQRVGPGHVDPSSCLHPSRVDDNALRLCTHLLGQVGHPLQLHFPLYCILIYILAPTTAPDSTLSATLLCDAMARIPGNGNFERRVEFSTVFHHYYGHRGYMLAQVGVTSEKPVPPLLASGRDIGCRTTLLGAHAHSPAPRLA